MVNLIFLGACGTVTGSKYLLNVYDKSYLIDCGLFQGGKEQKGKNWQEFPFDLKKIDGIILTHAHIDHSGFLPRLYNKGYRGPVYTTSSTKALLHILLPDAGELQEEEANFAEENKLTNFKPALPLFTKEDAKGSLKLLKSLDFYKNFELEEGISFTYKYAGHILGAAFIEFKIKARRNRYIRIVFSGDLGRKKHVIIKSPDFFESADYLILESTYGDRLHPEENIEELLKKIIDITFEQRGVILIPAFAVDRTQEVLVYLSRLIREEKKFRDMDVYIDSPMANEALNLYKQFYNEYNEAFIEEMGEGNPFNLPNFKPVKTVEESKRLNHMDKPCIIISASGMCNGGRIEHHLKFKLPNPKNTILFVGFQAEGTKGRRILDRRDSFIEIHKQRIEIKAKIEKINALSSHGDYDEILWWLENSSIPKKKFFITHGEKKARENLAVRLKERFKVETCLPEELEVFELDA